MKKVILITGLIFLLLAPPALADEKIFYKEKTDDGMIMFKYFFKDHGEDEDDEHEEDHDEDDDHEDEDDATPTPYPTISPVPTLQPSPSISPVPTTEPTVSPTATPTPEPVLGDDTEGIHSVIEEIRELILQLVAYLQGLTDEE